jgi:hypothetical protein
MLDPFYVSNDAEANHLSEPLLSNNIIADSTNTSLNDNNNMEPAASSQKESVPTAVSLLLLLLLLGLGSIVGITMAMIGLYCINSTIDVQWYPQIHVPASSSSSSSSASTLWSTPETTSSFLGNELCYMIATSLCAMLWSCITALISYWVYILIGITITDMIRIRYQPNPPKQHRCTTTTAATEIDNEDAFLQNETASLPPSTNDNCGLDQCMFALGTFVGFTTTCIVNDIYL